MKKILLGLFLLICCFSLVACETGGNPGGEPEGPGQGNVNEESNYLKEIKDYLNEYIPSAVTENIDLIDEYEYEDGSIALLEWSSSNGRTISSKGVFRANLFDEKITLTANIEVLTLEGDSEIATFSKEVETEGSEDVEAYKAIIEAYLPDYTYHDIELVTRDTTYANKNMFGIISYESKRPDVLTSEGKYVNTNKEDQVVEFCYSVAINGFVVEGSKNITVEGKKDDYYIEQASLYLDEYFKNETVVFDQLDLPETDTKGRVSITWRSSDLLVFSHEGKVLTYEPNFSAKMTATISCNEKSATWEKEFRTYGEDEILDFIVNRMHRDTIQQFKMGTAFYSSMNNGFIPFYVVDTAMSSLIKSTTVNDATINYLTGENNSSVKKLNIITGLKPYDNPGRPTTLKTSTDFITIHDTGSNESAAWWNQYESSGEDKRECSWHFTIGDTEVYQHVPLDEVAWHAGDGSARFGLNDTGVKYDGPNPEITIGKDNYLYINGQKSRIAVPIISGSSKTEYNGKPANEISPAGLYTELGANGNYYMASVHASTYSQNVLRFYVCTNGGNRNSIGIETCINQGVDYNQVMRNTANLVGHLLKYYNLNPSRVLLHQNFSGKLCPQVMIENNMFPNFHNVIENEYIIAKYLEGITFKYQSNNPELLSNEGKVLKTVSQDTKVSYSVTVTYKGQTKTYNMSTIIKAK